MKEMEHSSRQRESRQRERLDFLLQAFKED